MTEDEQSEACFRRAMELQWLPENEERTCKECQQMLIQEFGRPLVQKMLAAIHQFVKEK